jgi:hypothetical protein
VLVAPRALLVVDHQLHGVRVIVSSRVLFLLLRVGFITLFSFHLCVCLSTILSLFFLLLFFVFCVKVVVV